MKRGEVLSVVTSNLLFLSFFSLVLLSDQPTSWKFLLVACVATALLLINFALGWCFVTKMKASAKITADNWIVLSVVFAAFLLGLIGHGAYFAEKMGEFHIPFVCIVFLLLLFSLFWLYKSRHSKIGNKLVVSASNRRVKIILMVLFLFVVATSVRLIDTWDRWDSYSYIYAFNQLGEDIFDTDLLRLCGHLSQAYAIVGYLINGFFNNYSVALRVLNIVLVIVDSTVAFYILKEILPGKSVTMPLLGALLFALSPFSYGTIGYISLENFMVTCSLLTILFLIQKRYRLSFVAMTLLLFSKETASVIVAGIILGYTIKLMASAGFKLSKAVRENEEFISFTLSCLVLAGVWLYCFSQNRWGGGIDYIETADGSDFNSFGISLIYIADKMRLLFFSNFNWMLLTCIACSCVTLVWRGKRNDGPSSVDFTPLLPLVLMFAFDFTFSCVYITHNHFRYIQTTIVPIYLVFVFLLAHLNLKFKQERCVSVAVTILMLSQAYRTIDPLMLNAMPHFSTGVGQMVSSPNHLIDGDSFSVTDTIAYNREANMMDWCIDEALKEIEISQDDVLLFSNEYLSPSVNEPVGSLYWITGFGYHVVESPRFVSWDGDGRTLTDDAAQALDIRYVDEKNVSDTILEGQDFIYLEMPWGDTVLNDVVLPRCELKMSKEVQVGPWSMTAYRLYGARSY